MIKHVGKHNNQKVVILYRTIPNEEHMCLLAYSDSLPRIVHDSVMSTLESPTGQQADELSDALFRVTLADGNNALTTLHREGLMKKVPTAQVIVTPTATATIRLDELNDMLSKMKEGEEAVKKLAELDRSRGIKGSRPEPKDVGEPTLVNTNTDGVLSDADLAAQRLEQASNMKLEANKLLAEAMRLEKEASALTSTKTKTKTNVSKKTKTKAVQQN